MKTRLTIKSGIELAAMVDIVFLLVTYFLINSTLARNPAIKVDLPRSVTARVEVQKNIIVHIDASNQVYLNEKKISMDKLPDEIKSRAKQLGQNEVIIKGDKKADWQTVITVMDLVKKSGISKFNLATEQQ